MNAMPTHNLRDQLVPLAIAVAAAVALMLMVARIFGG
jgi:hypothetical protein